ncbi:MAG TPA: nucleotidyltransferase family protein [Sedimentisphaerales bacterium]|nr:nucleotidyltransferase family protein [Sedimentisphaerales bacterium]
MNNISDITAMILVGGLGTRLQSVVSDRPKVLAEVCGKPFLAYLLDQVALTGIRKVILCSGYMSEKVEEAFGENYSGMEICYSVEKTLLGTGGAVRLALSKLTSNYALILNGDSYIDADIKEYIRWYFAKRRLVALLLTGVDDSSRYGKVCIDEDERITAFNEKIAGSGPGLINAGMYLMDRLVIERIPANEVFSLEKKLFPAINKSEIYGFCCNASFIDIGTPQSYSVAENFFGKWSSENDN